MNRLAFHISFLFFALICYSSGASGQVLEGLSDIQIFQSGEELANPFVGGLNEPQFSNIHLNEDSELDLIVFDRSGDVLLPFLKDEQSSYTYKPSLIRDFPPIEQWVLFRDYNCDGKMDIFTSYPDSNGVRLFENQSSNGQLEFDLVADLIFAGDEAVYVPASDIPAIRDVDGDGDLDILSFDPAGLHVQLYENTSTDVCDPPSFVLAVTCWGNFQEAGLNNDITLNVACKRDNGISEHTSAHAGSSIGAFDADGDGDLDLLLGDLNHSNLVFLQNGGSNLSADIDLVQTNFPVNNVAVDLRQFPASFFLDLTDDGLHDLVVAPNIPGISLNVGNVWLYENIGTSSMPQFSLQQKDFLQEDMIDVGRGAKPVFFDVNGDGLMDIVVGNTILRDGNNQENSSLWVYRNAGTTTEPAFERLTSNYLQLNNLFNPPRFGLHPAFGDLDGDGDDDLLLGDESGKVHYFRNIAAIGSPPSFILHTPEYFGIDVGADAAPQLIDLNRDGLTDILIGERSGNINYFENTGSIGSPAFSSGGVPDLGEVDVLVPCCTGYSIPYVFENENGAYEMIVASEFGKLFHYSNIDGNLNGSFTLEDDDFGEVKEGSRISAHAADITGDGKKEWIIGNSRGGFNIMKESPPSSNVEREIDDLVKIWPNPGKAFFQLSLPSNRHPQTVTVFDVQGKIRARFEKEQVRQIRQFSSTEWENGIYLVQIQFLDGSSFSEKWILSK